MKLGKFKGKTYPVIFEFYGHTVDERNHSVYSVETGYEIGYAALAAVDSRGEDKTTETETKWVIENPFVLIALMNAMNSDRQRVGHRVITLVSVTIKNKVLHVRLYISHTLETLKRIDEVSVLSVLNEGLYKTQYLK